MGKLARSSSSSPSEEEEVEEEEEESEEEEQLTMLLPVWTGRRARSLPKRITRADITKKTKQVGLLHGGMSLALFARKYTAWLTGLGPEADNSQRCDFYLYSKLLLHYIPQTSSRPQVIFLIILIPKYTVSLLVKLQKPVHLTSLIIIATG